MAASHALLKALKARDAAALAQLLDRQRAQLGLDFLVTVPSHTPALLNSDAFAVTRGAHLAIVDGAEFALERQHGGDGGLGEARRDGSVKVHHRHALTAHHAGGNRIAHALVTRHRGWFVEHHDQCPPRPGQHRGV